MGDSVGLPNPSQEDLDFIVYVETESEKDGTTNLGFGLDSGGEDGGSEEYEVDDRAVLNVPEEYKNPHYEKVTTCLGADEVTEALDETEGVYAESLTSDGSEYLADTDIDVMKV